MKEYLPFKIIVIILAFISFILIFVVLVGATICLLLSLGILIFIIKEEKKLKKLDLSPTLTENAKVISKHTKVIGSMYHTTTLYYITFELANRDKKTFQILDMLYGTMIEGETGILSYKERAKMIKFIDFRKSQHSELIS